MSSYTGRFKMTVDEDENADLLRWRSRSSLLLAGHILFSWSAVLSTVLVQSISIHSLNESVRALPAVCNSLTQPDAACQNQWRIIACSGSEGLSSALRLQMALIKNCTTSTWLLLPVRIFWSSFHSLITRTLVHPLSCCKVEMLLPSPNLPGEDEWVRTYPYTVTL